MKFGLAIHLHTILLKTMHLAEEFIKQVYGKVLKFSKLPL